METQPTILVTGGAGYIGSHAVLALQSAGYRVLILDNLVYGHQELVETVLGVPVLVGDTNDRAFLDQLFQTHNIDAVMHFAAYAYVGESVKEPATYYRNNVVGTLTLIEAMLAANIKTFVFSSTCATYGVPERLPLTEGHPQNPINPYGQSKVMVEKILDDCDRAYEFRSVRFRYFNAAGADPEGRLGEDHNPETHLIPLTLQTALGKRDAIYIFGTDYPTPDGTCIRDYIHVNDLADAHVLGLQYLLNGGRTDRFNLGNGNGFSVREVIDTVKSVTQRDFKVIEQARRPGDPPSLVGSSARARQILNWQPQYADLEVIIRHAWQWHQQRHG